MKRVLLSAYACSPNKGSEEGNGWSWAINLARIGYEVHCLTNSLHRSEIEAALAASPVKGLTFHFVKLPFSLDERLVHGSFTIYLHYKLWQRSAGKTACRMHAAKPFDIGHHVTYGSLQQGSFLWRLAGIQLIFGPVGGGQQAPHALKHYFGKAWKIEQLRSLISRWSMRHNKNLRNTLQAADHVLVTNKDTEAMVLKTGLVQPGKMQLVLDNAVPPSMESLAYNEPAQAGVLKLLWVGRVMPRKGLNLVLHALSFLPPDTRYEFTIIGGGPLFGEIPGWIKQYGLAAKNIIVKGQVPFETVADYYRAADVFVFCSLRDSCPAQLTEAMAFSLPLVVLNIHGSAIAVPDNAGLKAAVGEGDQTAKNIAAAITKLAENPQLRRDMSKASFAFSKTFTWQNKISTVTETCYAFIAIIMYLCLQ